MSSPQIIEVVSDPTFLAERAADGFIQLAEKEVSKGRRFTVTLADGATPRMMYIRLQDAKINWEFIHFFWGNERCFPPEHVESNCHRAFEAFLSWIPIHSENVHRIRGELLVVQATQNYEQEFCNFISGTSPRFNLVLLGLGDDGHAASLFPGQRLEGEIL